MSRMESYKYEVARLVNALNYGNSVGLIPDQVREIDKAVCLAWGNCDDNLASGYYEGEKPKFPTEKFIYEWIENADFESEGFDIESLKNL